MFDVDHFKAINDNHGHPAGDQVLRSVTTRVQTLIRVEDVFARYGGEEFILLARGVKPKGLEQFAERIRKSVSKLRIQFEDRTLGVTISLGVASLNELGPETAASELLSLVDTRVYRAKIQGRNCTCAS